ncbi:MAG: protein-L-isoaspartate O-methyltransferase [Alphaproteobacteria bacterium]|jgi:protein-L-isoaspartate(D-aspartate) O-methyltransferase|nr:protein-L-isoaspartate O-methyltransferase [Alphaproteobacteria bacterium]
MQDMAAARLHMVEGQVRTNDVTDKRITGAMGLIERERFVPAANRALAYADVCVEVKPGRFLLDPRSLGKLLQLAEIQESDRVLDVACATGYSSAVLSTLSADVVALEEDEELAKEATAALRSVPKLGRLFGVVGPHRDGAPGQEPFDVVFVNGAVDEIPAAWVQQLKEGGRLLSILRDGPLGKANFCVRKGGALSRRVAFDATVPLLPGFERAKTFVF